jgi:hypothetical protein
MLRAMDEIQIQCEYEDPEGLKYMRLLVKGIQQGEPLEAVQSYFAALRQVAPMCGALKTVLNAKAWIRRNLAHSDFTFPNYDDEIAAEIAKLSAILPGPTSARVAECYDRLKYLLAESEKSKEECDKIWSKVVGPLADRGFKVKPRSIVIDTPPMPDEHVKKIVKLVQTALPASSVSFVSVEVRRLPGEPEVELGSRKRRHRGSVRSKRSKRSKRSRRLA